MFDTIHEEAFIKRLTQLRMQKGVSARDMSLSLGQSESYINKIENGAALPSMSVFFYICDYFKITPAEFFDVEVKDPSELQKVTEKLRRLDSEDLKHIDYVIEAMSK